MVGLLLSWAVLFFVQLFFNLFGIVSLWFRIFFLSSFMLFSTVFWIKWVEKNDLGSRLGFNEGGLTVLTYVFLSAIVLFFTQRSFWEATQLLCLFSVVPLFEEFFFRIHLLGSMVKEEGSCKNFISRVKVLGVPLLLTSLLFALVHDDVIAFMLNPSLEFFSFGGAVFARVIFGFASGDLYLIFNRRLVVPVTCHLTYNLSHFILYIMRT